MTSFSTEGLSDPDSWFKDRFYQALHRTIDSHPPLCYGILDETPDREAVFLRLPVVHRDDVAEFCGQGVSEEPADDDDLAIRRLLERSHARLLLEGHRKPAWRAVVFKHGGFWNSGSDIPKTQRVSIAFLANHAIADGLSHINFHRSWLHFFNNPEARVCVWPYNVPRDLRCPILLEDVVDLQSTDENDKSSINYGSPSLWSGSDMFLPSVEEYESGVRFITIPAAHISNIVNFTRSQKVTLTGIIHGLVVAFLSKYVPPGHEFLAVTPYSMRQVSKVSEEEICNHASGLVHEFAGPLVSALRATQENTSEELNLMTEVARIFQKDMTAELLRSPKNNAWAGMFGVKDWYSQSRAQLGKKRPLTYELSSFGNLKVVDVAEDTEKNALKLEKMIVSQCGSVTGPVFCCNCISIAGGPITVSLTWQKGSLEEKMIDGMAAYLERRLLAGFGDGI